jgi:hypothetical protein
VFSSSAGSEEGPKEPLAQHALTPHPALPLTHARPMRRELRRSVVRLYRASAAGHLTQSTPLSHPSLPSNTSNLLLSSSPFSFPLPCREDDDSRRNLSRAYPVLHRKETGRGQIRSLIDSDICLVCGYRVLFIPHHRLGACGVGWEVRGRRG